MKDEKNPKNWQSKDISNMKDEKNDVVITSSFQQINKNKKTFHEDSKLRIDSV